MKTQNLHRTSCAEWLLQTGWALSATSFFKILKPKTSFADWCENDSLKPVSLKGKQWNIKTKKDEEKNRMNQ